MPDDLYFEDALAWSEQQSARLRRVARGERVNDVDWEHVIEEIEDVGLSQLNSVCSFLRLMLVHLLKLHGWPDHPARQHWLIELDGFQADAIQRYAPLMERRIDIQGIYVRACRQVQKRKIDGLEARPAPKECPFSLDDLLRGDVDELARRLTT